jgi:glyoxylase-like metal-dependent hydrolase (beta-lactamase superfamily II)
VRRATMEIAPGIHNVVTEGAAAPGVTNTYLVIGTDGAVWIDTGWDRPGEAQARIDYWDKVGRPELKGIVVTHRHPPHWQNAPALQRASVATASTGSASSGSSGAAFTRSPARSQAPIIATAVEKDAIEQRMVGAKVDRVVEDGETLSLGNLTLEFVHAPGHTYGSLAVFVREPRALFTGDNVMGTGTSVVNPGEGEIALYLATMEKFIRYRPAGIYPGQGPVITEPDAKLRELIEHRRTREAQIVGLLKGGPKSVPELFASIYAGGGLDERIARLAHNQILSHLIKLEREGRASASGATYRLTGHSS